MDCSILPFAEKLLESEEDSLDTVTDFERLKTS